jgi:protein-tyrosine phosphatase
MDLIFQVGVAEVAAEPLAVQLGLVLALAVPDHVLPDEELLVAVTTFVRSLQSDMVT